MTSATFEDGAAFGRKHRKQDWANWVDVDEKQPRGYSPKGAADLQSAEPGSAPANIPVVHSASVGRAPRAVAVEGPPTRGGTASVYAFFDC